MLCKRLNISGLRPMLVGIVCLLGIVYVANAQAVKYYTDKTKLGFPTGNAVISPSGRVWMCSLSSGVYQLIGDSLVQYCRANGKIINDEVQSVAVDDSDRVWIAHYSLLASMKDDRIVSYEEYNSPFSYKFMPRYVAFNNKRKVVVGIGTYSEMNNYDDLFFSYNTRNGTWQTWDYSKNPTMQKLLEEIYGNIYAHTLDSSGVLCMQRGKYLVRFDSDSLTLEELPFGDRFKASKYDQGKDATVAITDRRGNIWLSNTQILCCFNGREWRTWDSSKAPFKGLRCLPKVAGVSMDSGIVLRTSRVDTKWGGYILDTSFVLFKNERLTGFTFTPAWEYATPCMLGSHEESFEFFTTRDAYLLPVACTVDTIGDERNGIVICWPNSTPVSTSIEDKCIGSKSSEGDEPAKYYVLQRKSKGSVRLSEPFSGEVRVYSVDGSEIAAEHYTSATVIDIPALNEGMYYAILSVKGKIAQRFAVAVW